MIKKEATFGRKRQNFQAMEDKRNNSFDLAPKKKNEAKYLFKFLENVISNVNKLLATQNKERKYAIRCRFEIVTSALPCYRKK